MRQQRSSDKSMTSIDGNHNNFNRHIQEVPGLTTKVFYPPEECIDKVPALKSMLE
jgi:hypothetical protein